ncbi:MAG: hypothetical protein AAFY08_16505, partial [Planctomycetota bacterium]
PPAPRAPSRRRARAVAREEEVEREAKRRRQEELDEARRRADDVARQQDSQQEGRQQRSQQWREAAGGGADGRIEAVAAAGAALGAGSGLGSGVDMGAAGAGLGAGRGAGPGAPRPGAEAVGAAARAPNAGGMSTAERMMAKMGYVRGKGLGKDEQGITTALAVDGAGVAGRGVIVDADAERRCEARGRARDWARPRACTCVPPALTRGARRRRRTRVV